METTETNQAPGMNAEPQSEHHWLQMMSSLWVYNGALQGNVLTLEAEGASFADPAKLSRYRDVIELESDDRRTLTSHVLGDDGKWVRFMTASYRRTAAR